MEGLLDFISVGCLIELSPALDQRQNLGIVSTEELDEIEAVSTRFRLFVRWFADKYCLLAGSEWINANYLFRRRLVDFAATISLYLQEHLEATRVAELPFNTINPVIFVKLVISHFSESWPELVLPFQQAMQNASRRLYYDGPEFTLLRLTDNTLKELRSLGFTESSDFSGLPLVAKEPNPGPPPPPKTPPPKRDRPSPMSTPNKSPSTSRPLKRSR